VSVWDALRTTSMNLCGNSFIITPPFSPSAIWVTRGGICRPASSQRPRLAASYQGCICATSLVSLPWVLMMAMMDAVSPVELVATRRCGMWRRSRPRPSASSTVCSCTMTQVKPQSRSVFTKA
jgi:hypothetical protein